MITIGAFEAKTHLSQLLDKVQQGEEIVITRRGRQVARLVPARSDAERGMDALTELREARKTVHLGGLCIREIIDEGRKY
jgi:prevent-host-death family protein